MKLAWIVVGIAMLAAPARAQPFTFEDSIQGELARPEGTRIAPAPGALRTFDDKTAGPRLAALDAALAGERDPVRRAEVLLTRADFFAAQARNERLLAITADLARHDTKDPAAQQAREAEVTRHRTVMAQASARAIADYTELYCDPADRQRGLDCADAAALRGWKRMDDALFRFAYTLDAVQRAGDAGKVYQRLIAGYPRSTYYPHAMLATAERAFEQADLATAEARYTQVLASNADAGTRAYARYKLAWVHLNLSRPQDAFAGFVAVATIAGNDPRTTVLVREARKDLVRAYAELGAPADAFDELERIVPGQGLTLLDRLAELWLDQGKAREALAAYGDLLARAPSDPRSCAWQHGIAGGAFQIGDRARQLAETTELVAALGRLRAQAVAADRLAECAEVAETTTLTFARALLREAKRVRLAPTCDAADRMYELYGKTFGSSEDVTRARIERAELATLRAELEGNTGDAPRLWQRAADRHAEALRDVRIDGAERALLETHRQEAVSRAAAPTAP